MRNKPAKGKLGFEYKHGTVVSTLL